jgi:hypothetical protein
MVTRVTQNSDTACAWACAGAAILEGIMLGSTAEHAVIATVQDLVKVSLDGVCKDSSCESYKAA